MEIANGMDGKIAELELESVYSFRGCGDDIRSTKRSQNWIGNIANVCVWQSRMILEKLNR